jgi:non-canonical purine NTP pyrophosphatase (RdgB/HAM1 family)
MKTVLFATGNSRKIQEARQSLAHYEIDVEPVSVSIDEIQHSDPSEIAKAKARAAYAVTKQPVVVSDTSWAIPALNGFPGGYMKDVAIWWDAQNWLDIMARQSDRRLICMEHVAYYDGTTLQHFVHEYEGYFATEARGRIDAFESFERLAVLYGNETMAEQLERGDIASAGEDLHHWKAFGEWLAAQS